MIKEQISTPAINKPKSGRSITTRIGAIGAGLASVTLLVVLWNLLLGAAQWYASFLALFTVILYTVSCYVKQPIVIAVLRYAAGFSAALSIFTALSLGAFLPFGLSDFVSPALGRFGGQGALLLLAGYFLARAIRQQRGGYLDLAIFCGVDCLWVGYNTARQATFPYPPTTKEEWANQLMLFFWLGLAALILAMILYFVAKWAAPTCLRWAVGSSLPGAGLGLYFQQTQVAVLCAIVLLLSLGALIFLQLNLKRRKPALNIVLQLLTLLLIIPSLSVLYISTAEQLETVLARNTLERFAQKGWWYLLGEDRFPEQRGLKVGTTPGGTISGTVLDKTGKPVPGANIVVGDSAGFTYTALSGADGKYTLPDIKPGHYLPMVARAGYLDTVATGISPLGAYRMVASVRGNATNSNINFVMEARQPFQVQAGNSLNFEEFTEVFRDNPVPSPAIRRKFSFENNGNTKSGLVYEPMPERGSGPFPIIFITYPGPASSWEGVSIPLAAQGFIVVAYQPELFGPHPERGLDLQGDVSDMVQLYNYVKSGQFSKRGDSQKVVITGGSVSTVYTYLLLREIETSSATDKAALKGAIKYGGLADMYRYRYDWDRGALYIDAGIQDLEYMLIAFGRPDLRPEIYLRFSPIYHLEQTSLPPLLLVHTSKDTIVPVAQTEILVKLMEQLNIKHTVLIYKDIEHYLDTSKPDPSQLDMLNQTIDFVKLVTQ